MSEVVTGLQNWELKQNSSPLRFHGMTIHREDCYPDARQAPLFEPDVSIEAIWRDEQKRDREGRRPFFTFCRNCMIYRPTSLAQWVIR